MKKSEVRIGMRAVVNDQVDTVIYTVDHLDGHQAYLTYKLEDGKTYVGGAVDVSVLKRPSRKQWEYAYDPTVRPRRYKLFSDPSHGWLEVPFSDVVTLGLRDKISSYSFLSDGEVLVYLEEDRDMTLFLQKLKEVGWKYEFKETHTDNESPIRRLRPYLYGEGA